MSDLPTAIEVHGSSYWANRRTAIETLRNEILVPYFDSVAVLRVANARAIDAAEVERAILMQAR